MNKEEKARAPLCHPREASAQVDTLPYRLVWPDVVSIRSRARTTATIETAREWTSAAGYDTGTVLAP